jgi:hypothetical protein
MKYISVRKDLVTIIKNGKHIFNGIRSIYTKDYSSGYYIKYDNKFYKAHSQYPKGYYVVI